MKKASSFLAFLLAVAFPLAALAQEHPEHPKKDTQKEHPKKEHPKKEHPKKEAASFSVDDLEKTIQADFAEKTKETNGFYELDDPEMKKSWSLKLDKVHKDRLSQLDAETYFACVDMKDADGKVVDVDFFVKSKDGKYETTDMTVHKVEGKPRYDWEEKDGFWKRVPLKSAGTN